MMRASLALPLITLFAAGAAAAADPTAADLLSYRQTNFESLGDHMKALGMMSKGKVPARNPDMISHASAIHEVSLVIPGLFPDGTGPDVVPKTEALAKLWQDRPGFEARAKALQDESAKLVEVAKGGDPAAFKAQFGAVGRTCGACHDDYRQKKD